MRVSVYPDGESTVVAPRTYRIFLNDVDVTRGCIMADDEKHLVRVYDRTMEEEYIRDPGDPTRLMTLEIYGRVRIEKREPE